MLNLKLAFRTLFRTPFVTIVAVLSLALGIGANSAIYSLVDQMLLRPLPVSQPERLVNFGAPGPNPGSQNCGQAGGCDVVFSYPMFRDLEAEPTGFSGIAAHVSVRREHRVQEPDVERRRDARLGLVLRRAGIAARARTIC